MRGGASALLARAYEVRNTLCRYLVSDLAQFEGLKAPNRRGDLIDQTEINATTRSICSSWREPVCISLIERRDVH
jgi:hypothetical protein